MMSDEKNGKGKTFFSLAIFGKRAKNLSSEIPLSNA